MHTSIQIVFVICNNTASDQRISLFNRLQHARYEHHIVVASVYKRLEAEGDDGDVVGVSYEEGSYDGDY
jgi:hypothetical protein